MRVILEIQKEERMYVKGIWIWHRNHLMKTMRKTRREECWRMQSRIARCTAYVWNRKEKVEINCIKPSKNILIPRWKSWWGEKEMCDSLIPPWAHHSKWTRSVLFPMNTHRFRGDTGHTLTFGQERSLSLFISGHPQLCPITQKIKRKSKFFFFI